MAPVVARAALQPREREASACTGDDDATRAAHMQTRAAAPHQGGPATIRPMLRMHVPRLKFEN
jgi:hypothetical protein